MKTRLTVLPESLRRALLANGADPDQPSVASAEAWAPSSLVDLNAPESIAEMEELTRKTLVRLAVTAPVVEDTDA
jgi:hypothetical protein